MKRIFSALFVMLWIVNFADAQKTTTTTVEITATEARMTDAIANVFARPVICDVVVKKYQSGAQWCIETENNTIDKATGRFTDHWFISSSDFYAIIGNTKTFDESSRSELRNYGIFLSQQYHKCDAILAPIFNFRTVQRNEKNAHKGDYEISISGYAADFVNFKNATSEDINLIIKSSGAQQNVGAADSQNIQLK